MKIKLSEVEGLSEMTKPNDLINFMLDNNYQIIVNDYGIGIELEISDIEDSWEFIKKFKKII
jgi:hypothetical protein